MPEEQPLQFATQRSCPLPAAISRSMSSSSSTPENQVSPTLHLTLKVRQTLRTFLLIKAQFPEVPFSTFVQKGLRFTQLQANLHASKLRLLRSLTLGNKIKLEEDSSSKLRTGEAALPALRGSPL
ncbi:hypothetical protein J5N97_002858 [Dioscorea zingiberensis]|uniref:Uncharacterized protein n=1 Tax=Dioscorea zingiberensis TaxID=325984 RepID=A0A9D5D4W4_9LILI|nr:hypothetical protein J5N97_002858 [Dioscorea zingiberensis]